jgi:large subunit ribosomal protein L10
MPSRLRRLLFLKACLKLKKGGEIVAKTDTKAIRPEKLEAVKEIKERFQKAKIVVFTEYQGHGEPGLPVKETQKLRRKIREGKGEIKVVKNTLAQKALKELKLDNLSSYFTNATALAFGFDDPVSTAKALFDFAKEHKSSPNSPGLPVIKGAWLEGGKVLDANQVRFLATLPPKPVLLAQVLGTLNAPATGLVTVLSGVLRGLVTVLDGIKKQKEKS